MIDCLKKNKRDVIVISSNEPHHISSIRARHRLAVQAIGLPIIDEGFIILYMNCIILIFYDCSNVHFTRDIIF